MNSQSLVILFPNAAHGNHYLQEIKAVLDQDSSLAVHTAAPGVSPLSNEEISSKLMEHSQGLLIFSICDKADLVAVMNCLVAQKEAIKKRRLRVIGASFLDHPEVAKLLMKRGCSDILPNDLSRKALKHKISQSIKILQNYGEKRPESTSLQLDSKNSQGDQAQAKPFLEIRKVTPMTLASDCWLVQKERDIRQVQGSWIIDLLGPGPSAGSWEASERAAEIWVWKPRSAGNAKNRDPFIVEKGAWQFKGRRPEFVWSDNCWRLIGETPELSFVNGADVRGIRFKAMSAFVLEVAENSRQASEKLPLIMSTIESELRFKTSDAKGKTADLHLAPEIPLSLAIWLSEDGSEQNAVHAVPIEYSEREIVAEVPCALFVEGQAFKMGLSGLGGEKLKKVYSVVLSHIQNCDKQTDLLKIRVTTAESLADTKIREVYDRRQDEIFSFLRSARGW